MGPEALAEAQRCNRPVLLSVGYAACHWCHVMAHESFEDADVAAVMNELFVNIKVDREERPDVDHVYMSALHALGEQGGWPLTMFLTPAGEPFWGGTYFPKEPRFGRPASSACCGEIARIFHEEPERIAPQHARCARRLAAAPRRPPTGEPRPAPISTSSARGSRAPSIRVNGGLPGAPKFPNPPILEFLCRHAPAAPDNAVGPRAPSCSPWSAWRCGGIHDHLGGGFARYASTSAGSCRISRRCSTTTPSSSSSMPSPARRDRQRAVPPTRPKGIVAWLQREMVTPEGAFAASLDADSKGVEGKFYVWALAEIREALGRRTRSSSPPLRRHRSTATGRSTNILNRLARRELPPDLESAARRPAGKLLARRASRVRPGLDDKVLADWNGLMIAALVRAGSLLGRPDWVALAERAYRFVRRIDGPRTGASAIPGAAAR